MCSPRKRSFSPAKPTHASCARYSAAHNLTSSHTNTRGTHANAFYNSKHMLKNNHCVRTITTRQREDEMLLVGAARNANSARALCCGAVAASLVCGVHWQRDKKKMNERRTPSNDTTTHATTVIMNTPPHYHQRGGRTADSTSLTFAKVVFTQKVCTWNSRNCLSVSAECFFGLGMAF